MNALDQYFIIGCAILAFANVAYSYLITKRIPKKVNQILRKASVVGVISSFLAFFISPLVSDIIITIFVCLSVLNVLILAVNEPFRVAKK